MHHGISEIVLVVAGKQVGIVTNFSLSLPDPVLAGGATFQIKTQGNVFKLALEKSGGPVNTGKGRLAYL